MSSQGQQSPAEPPTDRPDAAHPRVAVDVLQRDQRAVLFHGDQERTPPVYALSDGFGHRREVINWWQAACVRTFGHLQQEFPANQIVRDERLLAALTGDQSDDAHLRQRVLERSIDACDRAYRDLEGRAQEWLADSENSAEDYQSIDPADQDHVAMRPAFSRLDTEQARVLASLWDGFADREAITRWTHALPAVAEFDDLLDRSITTAIATDRHALDMLQQETHTAHNWRDRFAATILLPAFAARTDRLRAGERATASRSERTVPRG
ncbi:hypothetical protein ACFQL1_15075 [Halomicroarcula sp. GCM10025709]|uniref:hypothetical protein n=1 Tax=Haloarcula TaxID=2237 RepID=UPI0024C29029|nr:hypothetical protein [Halomicroarcula sp. YJ-61-S]